MTLDELAGDPEFRDLVAAAVLLLEERCARGIVSPAETLAIVALAEQPDEGDDAAVRAWQPTTKFRAAIQMVVTSTLAYYVGAVEALADDRMRLGSVVAELHAEEPHGGRGRDIFRRTIPGR